jgi:ABC-type nitrate/sulfonate/bicarbonate transport system substrate-binding protein
MQFFVFGATRVSGWDRCVAFGLGYGILAVEEAHGAMENMKNLSLSSGEGCSLASPGRRSVLAALGAVPMVLAGCAGAAGSKAARAAAPTASVSTSGAVPVRVKVFPGAQNLAHFAAIERGFYVQQGIEMHLLYTHNSVELRDDLARGAVELVHTAVDNAVAMRVSGGHDVVILCGGDNSMNELFVQRGIETIEALRGRVLIVDAPNTAYALQAKKILKMHGLRDGDYQVRQVGGTFQRVQAMQKDPSAAASMLNPPFSLQASDSGLRSLGRVADLLGPYQATSAFALRAWVDANGDVLTRYLAGYIQGVRWALTPANRDAATALLARNLRLTPALAERTYAALTDPRYGIAKDARFDTAGYANVLALRAEIEGQWNGTPPPPSYGVDLRWHAAALQRLAV